MALSPELLKSNTATESLTEDQIAAIVSLSVNDENQTIGKRIGELHGQYDHDIQEVTGLTKNQGEKSYDFLKRILGDFKEQTSELPTLKTKISAYETEIAGLQKKIQEGGTDEELKKQFQDTKNELTSLRAQYETEKSEFGEKIKGYENQIKTAKVNSEFEKALSELKFKPEFPDSVKNTLIQSAKEKLIRDYSPDWEKVEGKEILVFRDSEGNIIRNKQNALNPHTAKDLLSENLKDILDLGRKQKGTGTSSGGAGSGSEILDLSGSKTQVEADDKIVKHLMALGEVRGSGSFADKQKKIREENGIHKLPIR